MANGGNVFLIAIPLSLAFFLTISNHTAEGEELIEALNLEEECGVPVVYTGPLYDSATLQSMFVQRISLDQPGRLER
jgi:hypothetical protein